MRTDRSAQLLLAAALACAASAHPQTPPPAPPSTQLAADTFFTGIEKFEHNAARVTRVENDRNRDHQADRNAPHRLSTVYVFDYDAPGLYNPADVEVYRRKLHTVGSSETEWTCKTCDHRLKPGETVDACTRPLGPSSVESVVIEMHLEKLTFVHTIGDASHDVVCHES